MSLPVQALPAFEAVFEPLEGAIVTGGPDGDGLVPWQLILAGQPDDAEVMRLVEIAGEVAGIHTLPRYSLERLPDPAWVAARQRSLPPITAGRFRSDEHPSALQSLIRFSYAVFCLKIQLTLRSSKPTPSTSHN